ncbi:hypothetical protein [Castellaniella sp.]|uniref:hypothetical protein n=1 Tax=Castellaniella sp. TaxID=1955812 RepID=UPI002B001650|nr:hypothetical protein [Castellaniella sp.]
MSGKVNTVGVVADSSQVAVFDEEIAAVLVKENAWDNEEDFFYDSDAYRIVWEKPRSLADARRFVEQRLPGLFARYGGQEHIDDLTVVHLLNAAGDLVSAYQRPGSVVGASSLWSDSPSEVSLGAAAKSVDQQVTFGYYIDLDERGDFVADVRNAEGKTVYEIRAGDSLDEDESSIFDDGYMRDKHDVSGLTEYLRSLGVIPQDARVLPMQEFEQRLEARADAEAPAPT